jgi:hypothetical protein
MPKRILARGLYSIFLVLLLVLALSATTRPAYAYVDPGSGLLFVQMLGSTLAGMMFLLRKRVRQLFQRFGGERPAKQDTEAGNR